MVLVAILTVSRAMSDRFRAYERQAAAIMTRHGGAIARTIVIDDAPGDEPGDEPGDDLGDDLADDLREVHVVTFPDRAALAAYRADPALAALADERAAVIRATTILVGEDGPDYHA